MARGEPLSPFPRHGLSSLAIASPHLLDFLIENEIGIGGGETIGNIVEERLHGHLRRPQIRKHWPARTA